MIPPFAVLQPLQCRWCLSLVPFPPQFSIPRTAVAIAGAGLQRRAAKAGIATPGICNRTFRGNSISACLENTEAKLEHAQRMAAHSTPKTTPLDDRRSDQVSMHEVERIGFSDDAGAKNLPDLPGGKPNRPALGAKFSSNPRAEATEVRQAAGQPCKLEIASPCPCHDLDMSQVKTQF